MTTITFDTHLFIKKLKNIGCPEKQAEVHAEVLKDAFSEYSTNHKKELATKQDIKNLEVNLKNLEINLKNDMKHLATKTDIVDIMKWVAGMLVAQVAVGAILIKILS